MSVQNEKLKREEVIEEAAKAIAGMDWLTSDHLNKARAAFAVFEKAHAHECEMCRWKNEKLIEEARAGLAAFDEYWGAGAPVSPEHGRPWELIRGLLSVFEKAHTPTDDGECDGSGKCPAEMHVHGCYMPHRADQCDSPDEYGHLPAEPQGEPSDAQVLAALNAYAPWATEYHLSDWGEGSAEPMRAALRAALRAAGVGGE